jgi:MOSC domain-containing protein YiiM
LENEVRIGDRLQIGSAEFIETQPRMPCFKLGIRFDDIKMIKRFLESKRTGFYLAVVREGEVGVRLDSMNYRSQTFTEPQI